MTRPTFATRRVAASTAAVLVTGALGAATLAAAGPAAAAELSKTLDYSCQVTAGSLNLRTNIVGVTASTTVPDSVSPGDVIPPTEVRITLAMPEKLRSASVDQLFGVKARGASTNSYVSLTTGGKTEKVQIPSLAAGDTPIPQTAGATWTIPASGNTPAITTPAYAFDEVVLGMPSAFFINATIIDDLGEQVPSTLDCTAPAGANLTMGSIAVIGGTPPTTAPPTTAPPTAPPTTTPPKPKNVAPVFAKKTYAAKAKSGKSVKVKVLATDKNRDRLTYKIAKKPAKKAGKVSIKGNVVVFKAAKKFKGKAAFVVSVSDGKGGTAKANVVVTVKK